MSLVCSSWHFGIFFLGILNERELKFQWEIKWEVVIESNLKICMGIRNSQENSKLSGLNFKYHHQPDTSLMVSDPQHIFCSKLFMG